MINEDEQKPDNLKMIMLEDLKKYYNKKELTKKELQKHGFYESEINWIIKQGENKMNKITENEEEYIYTEKMKSGVRTHIINKKDVNKIRSIIRDQTRNKEKTTDYRKIIQRIIKDKKLKVDIEAFNGGRNRAKYYFKYYYYPMKILENLGEIKYKKGVVVKR